VKCGDDTTLLADCMEGLFQLTEIQAEEIQKWGTNINGTRARTSGSYKEEYSMSVDFEQKDEVEIVHDFVFHGNDTLGNHSFCG